jgi:hypothetical protein
MYKLRWVHYPLPIENTITNIFSEILSSKGIAFLLQSEKKNSSRINKKKKKIIGYHLKNKSCRLAING